MQKYLSCVLRVFPGARKIKAKPALTALFVCTLFLSLAHKGYTMQPPPPPLNIEQLKELISLADVVAVGRIGEVEHTESVVGEETRKTVLASLEVEKLIKGEIEGGSILIKETYPILKPPLPAGAAKAGNRPGKMIVGMRAGPSSYHGEYSPGSRIVVLLEKLGGSDEYRPLGSGSHDKHLAEFLIEADGIKALHFKFAADLNKYTESEDRFLDLIVRLKDSGSGEGNNE